jgi:RecA/RadA recombinase
MLVETASFLKPSVKRALQHNGVVSLVDLLRVPPIQLSAICRCTLDDAVSLREQAKVQTLSCQPAGSSRDAPLAVLFTTLADLLEREAELDALRIATFSRSLDSILGGGIPCGELVEISGAPGTGKTQMCMQLAVAVQLPVAFGGLNGEALYLDCEGSVVPGRLREIAAAACAQIHQIANGQYPLAAASDETMDAVRKAVAGFTVERVLRGTHYIRVLNLVDFVALLLHLPVMLQHEPYRGVRLVLIDSMAFHFRFGEAASDYAQRSRMLFSLGQHLQRAVAGERRTAVVVTNHVTQRSVPIHGRPQNVEQLEEGTGASDRQEAPGWQRELIPSLGDAWSHAVSTRLLVRHPLGHTATIMDDGVSQLRLVALLKAPGRPRAECTIRLCPSGIRNAPGPGKRPREE